MDCSPLCDRETTLVAESQLGFIEFIVSPSLELCGDVLDKVHQLADTPPPSSALAKTLAPPAADATLSAETATPTTRAEAGPAAEAKPEVTQHLQQSHSASATTSESIASNLRKIIVSSSASLSRKLNSIGSQAAAAVNLPQPQPQPQQHLHLQPTVTQQQQQRDFDAKSANYQHPVIKPNTSHSSVELRAPSDAAQPEPGGAVSAVSLFSASLCASSAIC